MDDKAAHTHARAFHGARAPASHLAQRALAAVQQHGAAARHAHEDAADVAVLARNGGTRAQEDNLSAIAAIRVQRRQRGRQAVPRRGIPRGARGGCERERVRRFRLNLHALRGGAQRRRRHGRAVQPRASQRAQLPAQQVLARQRAGWAARGHGGRRRRRRRRGCRRPGGAVCGRGRAAIHALLAAQRDGREDGGVQQRQARGQGGGGAEHDGALRSGRVGHHVRSRRRASLAARSCAAASAAAAQRGGPGGILRRFCHVSGRQVHHKGQRAPV
jgi:hypothetical protein